MRSFSFTILAALVCAVAVFAAPQQSTAHPTIRYVIQQVTSIFTCVPHVVGQTVEGSDFQREFVEFKRQFDVTLNALPNCPALEGLNQQYKCVTDSIEEFDRSFADLVDKVSMKDKLFAEEIKTDLKGQCIKSPPMLWKAFECSINALDKASTENELTKQWEKFQPQFEKHLDAWKQCVYPFCNMKELSYAYSLFIQYMETVAEEPTFEKFSDDLNLVLTNCF